MVTTHGITSAAGYYENTVRQKKDSTVKAKNNTASEQAVKSSEDKLSSKAKNYLDNLRKTYGDYDFIVADAGDDSDGKDGGSGVVILLSVRTET